MHKFEDKVPYQFVPEPLTVEEADRLANACETPIERLVVWTLLDTGSTSASFVTSLPEASSGSSASFG